MKEKIQNYISEYCLSVSSILSLDCFLFCQCFDFDLAFLISPECCGCKCSSPVECLNNILTGWKSHASLQKKQMIVPAIQVDLLCKAFSVLDWSKKNETFQMKYCCYHRFHSSCLKLARILFYTGCGYWVGTSWSPILTSLSWFHISTYIYC